jgi:hypothetical protein
MNDRNGVESGMAAFRMKSSVADAPVEFVHAGFFTPESVTRSSAAG